MYKGMKERNPDFTGYVRIEGTEMAYPVMYTPSDPEKYLHKDINGVDSDEGLPFIDSRCDIEPDSDNIIIYGHNMKDGSMFASIINYQDKAYYEEHPIRILSELNSTEPETIEELLRKRGLLKENSVIANES